MHQLGIARGLGIGANISAVVDDNEVEVLGDEGVLLIDLSASRAVPGFADGFRLAGARLSYLEHGDRFDMSTLEVEPAAAKLDGFELESGDEVPQPSGQDRPMAGDLFAKGQLLRLLREAIDGSRPEAFGYAFPEGEGGDQRGFRFRFHTLDDTQGWLSVHSGTGRYAILNIGLEISVIRRRDMLDP